MAVTLGTIYVTPKLIELEFTNSDLSSGILTVNHSLIACIPIVIVLDGSYNQVIPDNITFVSATQFTVDLYTFEVSGTWKIKVLGSDDESVLLLGGKLTIDVTPTQKRKIWVYEDKYGLRQEYTSAQTIDINTSPYLARLIGIREENN